MNLTGEKLRRNIVLEWINLKQASGRILIQETRLKFETIPYRVGDLDKEKITWFRFDSYHVLVVIQPFHGMNPFVS